MTPREWYAARIEYWTTIRDDHAARAVTISRLRLVTFLGGAVLAWLGITRSGPLLMISAATFVGFAVLVVRHARRLDAVAHAEAARGVNARGVARVDRDWRALTPVAHDDDRDLEHHPYARDLDVVGRASLLRWLGPSATVAGGRAIRRSLLNSPPAALVEGRQSAVNELAPKREWREAVLSEAAAGHPP